MRYRAWLAEEIRLRPTEPARFQSLANIRILIDSLLRINLISSIHSAHFFVKPPQSTKAVRIFALPEFWLRRENRLSEIN